MQKRKVSISIYALVNPSNDEVFYVGATCCTLKERLVGHMASRHSYWSTKIAGKIKTMYDEGNKPEIIHLEECSFKEASYWEDFYISLFRFYGYPINQLKSTYTKFYANKFN